jgi:phage terminase Nu1 subunit (DNA packaging protein)
MPLILKPKKKPAKPVLERPKQEEQPEKTKFQLDKEYVQARIDLTRVRERSALLILAREREELIEVGLVQKQVAYLLVAMRQRFLAIPTTYARKLMHKDNVTEVVGILKEAVHQALREAAELPQRAIDPNWLATLDEEE